LAAWAMPNSDANASTEATMATRTRCIRAVVVVR
jgi:hypothetical protein